MSQPVATKEIVDAQKLLAAKINEAKPIYVLRHTKQPSTAQA